MGRTSALHHETTEQTVGVGSVAALWDLGWRWYWSWVSGLLQGWLFELLRQFKGAWGQKTEQTVEVGSVAALWDLG